MVTGLGAQFSPLYSQEFREWNDNLQRKFEAKLVGIGAKTVKVENRAGKQIDVKIMDLSSADRNYVHDWDQSSPESYYELREWNDRRGRRFEARLVDVSLTTVKLANEAGKQIDFVISELTSPDKDYIRKWASGELDLAPSEFSKGIREWIDESGRKFDAKLVDVSSRTVKLENRTGKQIVFVIADLSDIDKSYIRNWSMSGVEVDPGSLEEIEKRLEFVSNGKSDFIALLINGDSSSLHKGNVVNAYNKLKMMGLGDNQIIVLSSKFEPTVARKRNQQCVNAVASEEVLKSVLNQLAKSCEPGDTVLMYTTGHGGTSSSKISNLALENRGRYHAGEFAEFVSKLKSKFISIMDQCYSGGFVKVIPPQRQNIISISAAPHDDKTFCGYFAKAFWNTIGDLKHDKNRDGIVSISEAFAVSMKEHRKKVNWVSTDGQIHVCPDDIVLMPKSD